MRVRLTLAVAAALALLSAAEAAPVQSVTMSMIRFYSNACNCWNAKVSGQISSTAAGEEVLILKQNCGRSFGTADGVAYTREGGFYETEIDFIPIESGPFSAVYRARWNGHLSAPVTIRGKLTVKTRKLPGGRVQVVVSTLSANPVNLKGKQVVLQRQSGTDWVRIAAAPLFPHPVTYYTFVARFAAPRRGWTVRALVPAKSATPCFIASPSAKWTS